MPVLPPEKGAMFVMPAAVTPGIAARRRSSSDQKLALDSGFS